MKQPAIVLYLHANSIAIALITHKNKNLTIEYYQESTDSCLLYDGIYSLPKVRQHIITLPIDNKKISCYIGLDSSLILDSFNQDNTVEGITQEISIDVGHTKKTYTATIPYPLFAQLHMLGIYVPMVIESITTVTWAYYYMFTQNKSTIALPFSDRTLLESEIHTLFSNYSVFCTNNIGKQTKLYTLSAVYVAGCQL